MDIHQSSRRLAMMIVMFMVSAVSEISGNIRRRLTLMITLLIKKMYANRDYFNTKSINIIIERKEFKVGFMIYYYYYQINYNINLYKLISILN